MNTPPMVYVEWVDSAGMGDWGDPERYEALRPHMVTTCGFLLVNDPEYVVVVQSLADPGGEHAQHDNAIAIPVCVITRRYELRADDVPF